MHTILLLIALVLIGGTNSFPLPRVHSPPAPVKRQILITSQCTPEASPNLLQELQDEGCNLVDIANSVSSAERENIWSCSPASSPSHQSAGQLFKELEAKLDFYKTVAGPGAPEVCRLDALVNHGELKDVVCSDGQDNQPAVSGADFPLWSQLSNASRSLCLLASIQTSLFTLAHKLKPKDLQLTQCNDILPKIWQAEEMMHFTKSISDQMNQTNVSCRTVNVTAAETVTTLTNISVLLGNGSLNCFSDELNRTIIPIIANLEQESVQTTPPSLDLGEDLDSEQLKFCLLKQVKNIMDGQLNRWNVNDNKCFRENYVAYRTETSCSH